ncbi:MAG TPA: hypothetical protein VEB59_02270, partial [Gemmatimonadales bacterium]|nr:hypothetical protein [Gemmatimonadales bacterium]
PEGSAEWKDTRGQIPLLKLVAESSRGTHHRPALSRSLTMQLGQLDVGLMNLRSTRDYNLIQAGKSITFGLGVNSDVHKAVITQLDTGSLFVSVPLSSGTDGRGIAPSLWNSSEAAQASTAFKAVIDSTLVEAREIMVRQVMGEEGASGVSKEAEFNATNSPLLARLAATREQFENTLLYFVALRFEREPNGSVVWPREFPIRDLVDDIDAMLDTIRKAQLSSPTLEKKLVLKKAETLGLLGDEAERKTIEAELEQAIADKQARKEQEASLFGDLSDAARDGRPVPVPTPTA